jgi:transcriptional antiterminator NusG
MNQEKEAAVAIPAAEEEKKWFSLRVISGKEKKIQERILLEIERSGWKNFIFSVVVPTEKVYKIRSGKKVMQERNLLPGYILIEAFGSKLNGDVAKKIADIPNVIHFLGKEHPIPMTQNEANRLLGKVDESAETGETLSEPFIVGETVKIIDGAFAEFVGDVQEVNEEKKKLKVVVKIFGRGTEMELNFMQVEKIS